MSDEGNDAERQSEAELALKRRRDNAEIVESTGLDENDKELLDQNKVERDHILVEITELKDRSEKRKKEREEEEKRLASERAAEDARRKAEEEERKKKKEEDEAKRHAARAQKAAEFEKWKSPPKANFVISKKVAAAGGEGEGDQTEEDQSESGRKSKEQLEAEKRAILHQRIKPLEIDGFDQGKLAEKARELHSLIHRLEGEKYDLERRFKSMQGQLMELADRARQANKVGKEGLKRIQGSEDDIDPIQTRFAGAPSKVEMYSKYERQKDKRTYVDRKVLYTGPQFGCPAERIKPQKIIKWNEEGMPVYDESAGGAPAE
jgi:hypothetical protein